MKELEKILEEIKEMLEDNKVFEINSDGTLDKCIADVQLVWNGTKDIIHKHMSDKDSNVPTDDGWIPVEEWLPEEKRANYEVTFINECGYEEHGFAQWYDGEFHVPAVVIAWRNHLEPYIPERSEGE